MKKLLLMAVALLFSCSLFAQQPAQAVPEPLPSREVSGVVKDAKGETIIGASVKLVSPKDSLVTTTNEDGIFIFKDVKLATFVLTIKFVGQATEIRRYKQNDVIKRIILDPVEMHDEGKVLTEVTINGQPSITYKTDTVEYRASDYKVRANATVDEMLRKAEGFEVGTDGSVTYNGEAVTKARLNGKDYAGGDVAQAIQSLPADIVEKFQVIDDYGDQAGRTGIRNGDASKVLNLTTRADRSVGNIVRLSANVGQNGRHDERIFAQRINGNQQIGVNATLSNTLNGVASTGRQGGANGGGGGGGNGSGGNTVAGNASVNYRDQVSKIMQITGSYNINYSDGNVLNLSNSLNTYRLERPVTKEIYTDTLLSTTNSTNLSNNKTHRASIEFEIVPDSSQFIRITPSFSVTNSSSNNIQEQIQTGFRNQIQNSKTGNSNNNPQFGLIAFYQYIFKKPRRNVSVQFNLTNGDQKQDNTQDTRIRITDDLGATTDSVINRIIARKNLSKNYRASLTYVEPLSLSSQLEFNGQINYRGYDNSLLTDSLTPAGTYERVERATNIFNYGFTEYRANLNYRLIKTKFNLSIGAQAIPTHLEGTNVSRGNIGVSRNNFFLVPLFRFQYQWSRQQQLAINYSGTPSEPTFDQIQPVPDQSQAGRVTIGNPNLKPAFRHTVSLRYSNYLANSRLNLSATINGSLNNNQIVSNTRLIIADKANITETSYVNMSGGKTLSGNYNISKSFSDRRYSLMLNGTASYNYSVGLNRDALQTTATYNFTNSFGPRINPNDIIEINPYVSHTLQRSFNSLNPAGNSNITRVSANLEGRFYFGKERTWTFEYDLSKNYVSGIANNAAKNPFVVNAFIEKQLFAKRNGVLRISAFDIFNQNNFINRNITSTGWTDTRSNLLSRYIMVGFTLNLQKWTGRPQRDGRSMMRRGDGSFIY